MERVGGAADGLRSHSLGLGIKYAMSLFSFFRSDPAAKTKRRIAQLQEEAMQLQRRGKILEYAEAMAEAARLEKQLEEPEAST